MAGAVSRIFKGKGTYGNTVSNSTPCAAYESSQSVARVDCVRWRAGLWPLARPPTLWGTDRAARRGGVLRVRWDPPHFDPHLTINNFTHTT